MKGYVTEDDIIHRLQIIRDLVRGGHMFDADVNLESLQRIMADEKLKSDNSDHAKCEHSMIYPTDGSKPQCKLCGKVSGHFA